MAFTLRTPKDSRDNRARAKTSTVPTTVGFLYRNNLSSGAFESCDASTTQVYPLYLAQETILAGDGRTDALCSIVNLSDEFVVDTVNNSNSAHNGQTMILNSTGDKLNNTGTDSTTGVFTQVDVVGASTAKQILARRAN